MIKAIIFDMGGVMLLNKVEAVYQRLSELLGIDSALFKEFQKKHNKEMLSGKISAKEFADIVKNEFNLDADVLEKWKKAYYTVMPVNNELLNVVDKLKKNYKVAIISNVPELHAKINEERGVFAHFEPALTSYNLGIIKPDKEIFELMLKRLNLKAEECIFIDDREEHLHTPKKMGFQVIHYKNNVQVIKELRKKGIK